MRAERDRRAAILATEGIKQSQVLTAEGGKQSAVLRAEGQVQSAILKVQGESRTILQVFDAIHRGSADSELLAYQYLQTLLEVANGSSSKMRIVLTGFTATLDGTAGAPGGGKGGGPGDSDDFNDSAARPGVDLSDSELDLGIASDLASISLQAPEEALTQARGEVESASQEASKEPASKAGVSPKTSTNKADGETTVSVLTSDDLEGSHVAHGSHMSTPKEAQPGLVLPRGSYDIQIQPGCDTLPGVSQDPYRA